VGLLSAHRIQYIRNGRVIGIRLYAVEPNGCMERVGFRNGDIIRQIDDTKIDLPNSETVEESSAALHPHEAALQTAKLITIERLGTKMTFQCAKSK
jgi:type II secretory pathway component PulC